MRFLLIHLQLQGESELEESMPLKHLHSGGFFCTLQELVWKNSSNWSRSRVARAAAIWMFLCRLSALLSEKMMLVLRS